jgi:hypothetical protein
MTNPSLGEILGTQISDKKAHCLLELEQHTAQKGLCAERDLQVVKDFFHRAITQFTTDILARIEVKPLMLGNGHHEAVAAILQSYRWKRENGIGQPTHPYHALWQTFQAWCSENDLQPQIEYYCDGIGKQSWHQLSVKPALWQHQPAPQAASELRV